VSSLEALARGAGEAEIVLAVLDARRGEAFAAAWRGGHALAPAAALGPEELADRVRALPATPLAVGDGALAFRDALEHAGAEIPADASPLHRVAARHLCRLAAGRDATDRGPEPDYVRAPDAQRPIQSP
jgi:tRNA threonylcarbamoyladenosine biosynthesis protein TsaB